MRSLILALLIAAVSLSASEITGKWSGKWETSPDGGPGPHYMVLKQDGAAVTGTAGPTAAQQMPISNGKMQGDKLTFDIGVPNGPSLKFDFKVAGDKMDGQAIFAMGGKEQTLKLSAERVKE